MSYPVNHNFCIFFCHRFFKNRLAERLVEIRDEVPRIQIPIYTVDVYILFVRLAVDLKANEVEKKKRLVDDCCSYFSTRNLFELSVSAITILCLRNIDL